MNKKKIFDIAFYILGTGIVAVVFFIVSINFYNNSRLLGQNYAVVDSSDNEDKNFDESKDDYNIEDENESEDSEFDTIRFEASEDVYIPISPVEDEEMGKYVEAEAEDEDEQDSESLCEEDSPRVLIYNHSGVEGLGDKIKENLENRGFCVELVNETDTRRGSTIVVEQTEDGFGVKVRDVLKTGQLVRELSKEPEHHVIIAIGEDYVP